MDLSIDLGKIRLKNPLICASSEVTMTAEGIHAAIDAGAGAVIAKSVNESPEAARQLSTADYVLLDADWQVIPWSSPARRNASLFCRSGLAQTPLSEWLRMLGELDRYAQEKECIVAGSITVATADGAAEIARKMQATGLRWIEVNLSAPHGREASAVRQVTEADLVREFARTLRRAVTIPLAIKLTAQTDDPLLLARIAMEEGADMVVLTGRVQGFMPDIETHKPILGSWGAIGGAWALPTSLYWVSKCWRNVSRDIPIIGTNGARSADDVLRFLLSGATAVELASVVMTDGPKVLTEMIEDLERYCVCKQITKIRELVGRAAAEALSYSELPVISRDCYPWERE